jgi:multidrug efflux pump subunit AcrA (membrane-fusion protein)
MKNVKTSLIGLMVFTAGISFNSELLAEKSELHTVVIHKEDVSKRQMLNGQVEAVNKSTLSAETNGTIEELYYDVGDMVEKGKIIARIKSNTQKAGLQQAQASVGEARAVVEKAKAAYTAAVAQYNVAKSEFDRIKKIFQKKLISRSEYDRAESAMKSARAQVGAARAAWNAAKSGVAAAQARQQQAGEQLGYTEVVAPFSGIVTERHVELGEIVVPGKPIMTGISLTELRVITEVPQRLIQAVRKYKNADVYILGDAPPLPVKSLVIFPYADPATNAFKVRAELEGGIKEVFPGTFVKIAFEIGKESRLVIPEKAVAYRGEVTAVYVLNDRGQPSMRQVRLGHHMDNGKILVMAGLSDGDTIVTDPVQAAFYLKQLKMNTNINAREKGHD